MGTSATKAKAKYNKKNYKSFSCLLKPELHNRIKEYCDKKELSRSQFLNLAIKTLEENE